MNRYKEVTGRKKRLAYTLDNTLSHMLKEGNSRKGPGAIPGHKASLSFVIKKKKKKTTKKKICRVRHPETSQGEEYVSTNLRAVVL